MHVFLDLDHTLVFSDFERHDPHNVEAITINDINDTQISFFVHVRPGCLFLVSKILDCGHSVSIWSAGSVSYVRAISSLLQSLLKRQNVDEPFRFVIALNQRFDKMKTIQYSWKDIKSGRSLSHWTSNFPTKKLSYTSVLRCNPRHCLLVDDMLKGPQIVTVPKFTGEYDEALKWIVWEIILIFSNHALEKTNGTKVKSGRLGYKCGV